MSQWVLKANGKVVPLCTVRPLCIDELHCEHKKKKRDLFDKLIKKRWGTVLSPPVKDDVPEYEPYKDAEEKPVVLNNIEKPVDSNGRLIDQQPTYDCLLNAELLLRKGDSLSRGKVTKRVVGSDGQQLGTYDNNPILNTMLYEVEFDNSDIVEYAANVIVENMIGQADDDGFSHATLRSIDDYKQDATALPKE